jgi:YggT family protein
MITWVVGSLIYGLLLFFKVIYYLIWIDIILSWLNVFGIRIVIWPIMSITQPIYALVRKILPTNIGVIDLAPLIIIIGIQILIAMLQPLI